MKQPIVNCQVRVETGIIGFDSEWADMGNPDGAIYRDVHVVTAEGADGSRWVRGQFPQPVAERLAKRVKAAGVIDLTYWSETYAAYGSAAYLRNEADYVLAERQADEERYWR